MKLVRRATGWLADMPVLVQLGLLACGLGAAGDVFYHVGPYSLGLALEWLFGPDGVYVHLVVLVGMTLILAGLVQLALRPWTTRAFIPQAIATQTEEK